MADKAILSFNSAKHEYRAAGYVLPSVTQTIRASVEAWGAGDWYLKRGTAVHAAIHLHLHGKLNLEQWSAELRDALEPDKAEAIIGRTRAAIRFMEDHPKLTIIATEVRLFSQRYQFAGCLDAHFRTDESIPVIADWKGSLDPVACDAQLGAYSILYRENLGEPVQKAVAVETRDDGSYRLRWGTRKPERDKAQFDLREAENAFVSMLNVYNWKSKHAQ